ncbi:MAG: acetylxylan esterase, partial [Gemmatimonadota bacterium]|nr:acetylxylan esterase [Gemmatimonadota bacterium]
MKLFPRTSASGLVLFLLIISACQPVPSVYSQAFGKVRPAPDSAYTALTGKEGVHAPDSMLFFHMDRIAQKMFRRREEKLERVRTAEQWQEYVAETKRKFLEMLGEFPVERPPIEARLTGRVERPDYIIEKVLFEALPDYPVTALVYVPKNFKPPFPAFICPVGHSPAGKCVSRGRRLSLARKGYLVIAIDPIGLGERKPLVNPVTGKSLVEMREHSLLGHQTILTGTGLGMYFIWDGIRAIDYLCTREDVDTSRIACAGISGGGNVTSWLAAVDERIKVAMPVCHVTSNRRRWESLLAADAEQNLIPCIAGGLEYGDVLMLVAPRKLLIACTSRDFFPIRGAYEAFHDAMRYYRFLKISDRLKISEVPGGHSWPLAQRKNTYAWVNRWFGKSGVGVEEEPFTPDSYHDLQATETGLQETAFGKKDIFELNRDYYHRVAPNRPAPAGRAQVEAAVDSLRKEFRRLTGYVKPRGEVPFRKTGRMTRDSLVIEKLVYYSEPDVYVPALLFKPEGAGDRLPALIYCHDKGKAAEAESGLWVSQVARQGIAVLCIDLRGTGETRTFRQYRDTEEGYHALLWGSETNMSFDAMMIGRSLLGMRAVDIVRGVDYLCSRPDIDSSRIGCFGQEESAMACLTAGVLDKRLAPVILSRLPVSYCSIVENPLYNWHVNIFLPGVLKVMDIDQAAGLVAPRPVLMLNTADHMRRVLPGTEVEREYSWAGRVYSVTGGEGRFRIACYRSPQEKFKEISA